jgi:hypothetical protein
LGFDAFGDRFDPHIPEKRRHRADARFIALFASYFADKRLFNFDRPNASLTGTTTTNVWVYRNFRTLELSVFLVVRKDSLPRASKNF